MFEPAPAFAALPPPTTPEVVLWTLSVLVLSGFLGTFRAALARSLPARTLAEVRRPRQRARLEPLLERAERLAVSAGIYKVTCDLLFVALLVGAMTADGAFDAAHVALAVLIAAPVLLLLTEVLPTSVASAWGDRLLRRTLPTFHLLQLPVAWLVVALEALRNAVLRALHIQDAGYSRKLVEGLREVAEGAAQSELEDTERELIENVLDFKDVDCAEVMTPRTEIDAMTVDTSLEEAARLFAGVGHSRIPVFAESIDNVIGTVRALEVTKALVADQRPRDLSELTRPPLLVPETMLVSELLKTFRTEQQKLAIVVDEYGGTAGLVTLTDVLEELVGEIRDEYEEAEENVRELTPGMYEVEAGLHVSEVNEALGLDIPEEEDFETLGGFVLAQLGRLPDAGASFRRDEVTYSVSEASDRRIIKVRVQRSA